MLTLRIICAHVMLTDCLLIECKMSLIYVGMDMSLKCTVRSFDTEIGVSPAVSMFSEYLLSLIQTISRFLRLTFDTKNDWGNPSKTFKLLEWSQLINWYRYWSLGGFLSAVAEDSVSLGFKAASVRKRTPKFRRIVPSNGSDHIIHWCNVKSL